MPEGQVSRIRSCIAELTLANDTAYLSGIDRCLKVPENESLGRAIACLSCVWIVVGWIWRFQRRITKLWKPEAKHTKSKVIVETSSSVDEIKSRDQIEFCLMDSSSTLSSIPIVLPKSLSPGYNTQESSSTIENNEPIDDMELANTKNPTSTKFASEKSDLGSYKCPDLCSPSGHDPSNAKPQSPHRTPLFPTYNFDVTCEQERSKLREYFSARLAHKPVLPVRYGEIAFVDENGRPYKRKFIKGRGWVLSKLLREERKRFGDNCFVMEKREREYEKGEF